jgi:hypothetical protein
MLRHRPLTRFFVQVILLYALLMAPWPGVAAAYGLLYRGAAIILFSTIGSRGEVDFRAREPGAGGHDTTVTLINRQEDYFARKRMTISTRYYGYAPTALLVALALATPIPWPRRTRLLMWGFLFVQVFVTFQMALPLLEAFTGDSEVALWTLAPFWRVIVIRLTDLLAESVVTGFTIPIFIWIGVLLGRGDWRSLRELLTNPPADRSG